VVQQDFGILLTSAIKRSKELDKKTIPCYVTGINSLLFAFKLSQHLTNIWQRYVGSTTFENLRGYFASFVSKKIVTFQYFF